MQIDKQEQDAIFTRRSLILGGGGAAVFVALGARLYTLQVLESERYRTLSEDNQFNFLLTPPSRGRILDRAGRVIADNRDSYRVLLVPEQAGDLELAVERLASVVPMSPETQERILEAARRAPGFRAITALDDLDWETFSAVNLNAPDLAGVIPNVAEVRRYTSGQAFAHVLGYVQPAGEIDAGDDPLLRYPGFRIGRAGVEAARESSLRGSAGSLKVEVNAYGRVIRELPEQSIPADPGTDIRLTLDAEVQDFANGRLAGESASTVAMDGQTGDLLALNSTPSFDPNLFVRGISVADYGMLTEDNFRPLANKTVQGAYPPGSTFKMLTALAALEEGLISPDDTVYCPGHLEVAERKFHCWKRAGHGWVDLSNSLKQSCDVYYYEVARRVGIEKIGEMARRLGLGVDTELPVAAMRSGLIPTKSWKRQRHETQWLVGDTLNSGIGQGYVLATPLQLAVMTARTASGRMLQPRLIRARAGSPVIAEQPEDLGIDPRNLARVRQGMFDVVNSARGTARRSRIKDEDFEMAGKTGTSQVRNITKAERARGVVRNEDLPWHRRDHALFVGYAPADNPRYAVAVAVEHGGGGSKAAAPIAKDILSKVREHYGTGKSTPLEQGQGGPGDAASRT